MTASGQRYLVALASHARAVGAQDRERFRARVDKALAETPSVLVVTCHRVEAYAEVHDLPEDVLAALPEGARVLWDTDAAAHAIEMALGLDSTVLAEDQVLHQLRAAVRDAPARSREGVLGRLFQSALRAGRRARAERVHARRSVADVALDRLGKEWLAGKDVLVVGAGMMGRLVAEAARRRGAAVTIASRSRVRAEALAREVGGRSTAIDATEELSRAALIVVALGGPWSLSASAAERVASATPRVIDLSAPPALPESVRGELGHRLLTVDDLARTPTATRGEAERLRDERRRLEHLRDRTLTEFLGWLERRSATTTIQALTQHAEAERRAELEHLWQRLPELEPGERDAIEGMTRHLAQRLLREPLTRLARDADGARQRAARELFGL